MAVLPPYETANTATLAGKTAIISVSYGRD